MSVTWYHKYIEYQIEVCFFHDNVILLNVLLMFLHTKGKSA